VAESPTYAQAAATDAHHTPPSHSSRWWHHHFCAAEKHKLTSPCGVRTASLPVAICGPPRALKLSVISRKAAAWQQQQQQIEHDCAMYEVSANYAHTLLAEPFDCLSPSLMRQPDSAAAAAALFDYDRYAHKHASHRSYCKLILLLEPDAYQM
jgi:hypothetical protein